MITREMIVEFEDFLNEPPRTWDIEPMEVRDYRHQAYRKWEPICRALIAQLENPTPDRRGMAGGEL